MNQRDWDGVLVGNIDLLGLESLQPLIDEAIPTATPHRFCNPTLRPENHAKNNAIPDSVRQPSS